MASTAILLGPPAISGDTPPLVKPDISSSATLVSDEKTVISQTATLNLSGEPPMGLTENRSPTFLSSGNPCLDFFFHVVPDTSPDELIERLILSWSHDPLTTFKLVCNLRGVRGTGKSDKEGFYTAASWIYQNHPKTLALNLQALVDFGYLKDLPEILYRILEGQQMERGKGRTWRKKTQRKFKRKSEKTQEVSKEMEDRILENVEDIGGPIDKNKARVLRKQRDLEKAKKALERYNSDVNYRLLFDRIADLFADMLKSDLKYLNSKELNKIGLASKWCPSVDSSYDKSTLICEAIARRIFSREEYKGIEEAHYAYRIRDRLRKQVLVPLHKALELPEVFMSAKDWNSLKYQRVASVAMKNYKKLFEEHDSERFTEFLGDVKTGKAKIAAGALLPHEIIKQLEESESDVTADVAELQWARMVDDLAKKGKLKNSMAVCDVSGSMSGTPMEVCVALGLLVSELNEEPWKGKVITFSENPQLHIIAGSSLREKTEFIKQMDWGMNTDFQKVFDRILDIAVENNLTNDQMIKRIFVFSDMEFDNATGNNHYAVNYTLSLEARRMTSKQRATEKWETDYEVVQRKYKEKGFENAPEMVFWNLRSSLATPVVAKQKGVAMVSGFSKNLLTLFLEEGGITSPEDVMWLAIKGEEYKKLAIFD